jgi:hypothetical protein
MGGYGGKERREPMIDEIDTLLKEAGYPARNIRECNGLMVLAMDWNRIKISTHLSPRMVKMKVKNLLGDRNVRVRVI